MKNHRSAEATISLEAQQQLIEDVRQRRAIEACGVLIGEISEQGNWHVRQVCPLPNIFNSPVYFEFAPEDLLAVELSYPGQIIGVYHSHPTGFAIASDTDRQNMQRVNQEQHIPWVWLIIRGPFSEHFTAQAGQSSIEKLIIAYHHYEQGNLQQIPLIAEQTVSDTCYLPPPPASRY
jgi:proteasome lid subunit RPN8/RPN11